MIARRRFISLVGSAVAWPVAAQRRQRSAAREGHLELGRRARAGGHSRRAPYFSSTSASRCLARFRSSIEDRVHRQGDRAHRDRGKLPRACGRSSGLRRAAADGRIRRRPAAASRRTPVSILRCSIDRATSAGIRRHYFQLGLSHPIRSNHDAIAVLIIRARSELR